jgi:hypothetical protein
MEKEQNKYKTYETLSTLFVIAFCMAMFIKFLFF